MREHPKGPEALSARRATVEAEVIAEVPFATPTMQCRTRGWDWLTDTQMGWDFVFGEFCEVASRGSLDDLLKKIYRNKSLL